MMGPNVELVGDTLLMSMMLFAGVGLANEVVFVSSSPLHVVNRCCPDLPVSSQFLYYNEIICQSRRTDAAPVTAFQGRRS